MVLPVFSVYYDWLVGTVAVAFLWEVAEEVWEVVAAAEIGEVEEEAVVVEGLSQNQGLVVYVQIEELVG